jgi:hypothetical protein
MRRREALLAVAGAAAAVAQGKPNLSGRWVLDPQQSELGPKMRAGGYRETLVIEHRDPRLRIDYTVTYGGDKLHTIYELTTDGAENRTKTPLGEEVTRSTWEGERLVSDATLNGERTRITRWLSPDGKLLHQIYQKDNSKKPGTMVFVRG